jgi:hypothetical protein
MRACKTAEEAGVPAFAIVSTGFLRQAHASARALGIEGAWVAEYPGVIPTDSRDQLEKKVRDVVVSNLLAGFAAPIQEPTAAAVEPAPTDIVFTGSFDAVQDHFHDHLWSDGLPVVPPTLGRVDAFMSFTARERSEVLGILHPEHRAATVWSVAVNGVMAGCRPEYMPVLLSVADAIADPEFRLEDAGSTPGWEPLVVVSGPIAAQLEFNTEGGLMRVGPQANTSIGRFLRMYMRNVAGWRTPPGTTDKGSIGSTFNVALAEDDAMVEELGWPSFREDLGFDPADSVVTVQSVVAISPPIYSGGDTPDQLMEPISHLMATTMGPWSFTGLWYGRKHPLLLLSPAVARAFAACGWGKDEIRQQLFDEVTLEARWLERYPFHVAGADDSLARRVDEGLIPALYAASDDPERQVPLLRRPEWTGIVVAGDPGRNQSKVYVNNHEQGPPVSRRVVLPDDWETRVSTRRSPSGHDNQS